MIAADIVANMFGVKTAEDTNPITNTVESTFTRVLGNNPNRLSMTVINLSANNVYLNVSRDVSTENGILLMANGGSVNLNVRDDFTLPTREWFAVAEVDDCAVYILETFISSSV